ncbi:MAG: cache domain-containing protein [Acidobacteriia bacterium]|nr:cache domain-containing protein [Terriglobia bacterium]
MPLDSLELRTSLQRVLIGLILILVPLTVFGFYVALQGDSQIRQMAGENIRSVTRTSAELTSQFIAGRLRDVSLIANNPSIVQAVAAANQPYERLSEDAILSKVGALEEKWNNSEGDVLAKNILASDLARQLRRMRDLNPLLLKITVADSSGATVAATDKPVHYFQTDRGYWAVLYAQGQGAIHVADVRYDEQNRLPYISIAYPILQEGTGRFVGAATALVDVSPLFAQLNRQQIGHTGRLSLVRDDGTVIQAPGVTTSMKIHSEEYSAIRDSLGTLRGRETGYLFTTFSKGEPYLVGFADAGLKDAFPNLSWIVVASQEQREITGPIRNVAAFALFVMILSLLMLSLLAAYVFLHRRQKIEDIETPEDKLHPTAA